MSRIIIFIAIVVFAACTTNEKKAKPNPNVPPKYAVTVEPEFKHQGNLSFVTRKGAELISIKVEIADSHAKREQGMMHRKSMDDDKGMLFIFPDEKRRSFWMKNCHIPLDIIFVNAANEIVYIAENCQPYSTQSIPSFEYAQYVVEVNASFCKNHNIRVGNSIEYNIISND